MTTLEETVAEIKELFEDGLQASDVFKMVPIVMQAVEDKGGLSGSQKKARVMQIIDLLLRDVDLPGPDWITKRAIMWLLEQSIDILVEVSKGKFSF